MKIQHPFPRSKQGEGDRYNTYTRKCMECYETIVLPWNAQIECYAATCACGAHCSTTIVSLDVTAVAEDAARKADDLLPGLGKLVREGKLAPGDDP
jgi:hypothetical protein